MPVLRRALVTTTLALLVPASASALPRVSTEISADGGFQVRPASIGYAGEGSAVLGGGDGRDGFHPGHLDWSSYRKRGAYATGVNWLNTCNPDCKHGHFTPAAAKVHVYRPRDNRFTRMSLRYRETDGRHVFDHFTLSHQPGFWAWLVDTD